MFDARTLGGIYKHGALYVRMTKDFSSTVKEVRYVCMTYMFYCRINWFFLIAHSLHLKYMIIKSDWLCTAQDIHVNFVSWLVETMHDNNQVRNYSKLSLHNLHFLSSITCTK